MVRDNTIFFKDKDDESKATTKNKYLINKMIREKVGLKQVTAIIQNIFAAPKEI